MRIGLIHNEYGVHSGEETSFYRIGDLLRRRGHEVFYLTRSSGDIRGLSGRIGAFFSGIYSIESRRQVRAFLRDVRPDLVQVQNLFPLISPSVLPVIHEAGVPIVMRCANYRLICPNGLLLRNGRPCHRCVGGREAWCFLTNCEKSPARSLGYALRSHAARRLGWYHRFVTRFYTLTAFQKEMLVRGGYEESKIDIIPNMIDHPARPFRAGNYVAYLGRLSEEKGIRTLLQAAEQCKNIIFRVAGPAGDGFDPDRLPQNVRYVGFVQGLQKERFLRNAAMVVVPSICYEGMPCSILEAMDHMTPVIASDIGGLGEIVRHGQTGLCFTPGDSCDLVHKIRMLWDTPDARRELAERASQRLFSEYSENTYYERLMNVYQRALNQTGHQSGELPARESVMEVSASGFPEAY